MDHSLICIEWLWNQLTCSAFIYHCNDFPFLTFDGVMKLWLVPFVMVIDVVWILISDQLLF